jgi:hypothetical protein
VDAEERIRLYKRCQQTQCMNMASNGQPPDPHATCHLGGGKWFIRPSSSTWGYHAAAGHAGIGSSRPPCRFSYAKSVMIPLSDPPRMDGREGSEKSSRGGDWEDRSGICESKKKKGLPSEGGPSVSTPFSRPSESSHQKGGPTPGAAVATIFKGSMGASRHSQLVR